MTARVAVFFCCSEDGDGGARLNITKDKTFYAPPPPAPTQSTNEKMGDKAFVR